MAGPAATPETNSSTASGPPVAATASLQGILDQVENLGERRPDDADGDAQHDVQQVLGCHGPRRTTGRDKVSFQHACDRPASAVTLASTTAPEGLRSEVAQDQFRRRTARRGVVKVAEMPAAAAHMRPAARTCAVSIEVSLGDLERAADPDLNNRTLAPDRSPPLCTTPTQVLTIGDLPGDSGRCGD